MSVLGLLVLGGMGKNGLEGRGRDRQRRGTGIDEGKLGAGRGREIFRASIEERAMRLGL
jgi:hypothetical protein